MSDSKIIENALKRFGVFYDSFTYEIFKSGHINSTFKVSIKKNKIETVYILQKVNTYVFKDPVGVMNNIALVTEHIKNKLIAEGKDTAKSVLSFVKAPNGKNYVYGDDDSFWRMYDYIPNTRTYDNVEDPRLLYNAGLAFGNFQKQLSDFPMDRLVDTIPDFHNTKKRFDSLFKSVEADPLGRAKELKSEIAFFEKRYELSGRLIQLNLSGKIPLRVTHNDTKYNNILIDCDTGEAVCVIDLDTVIPGLCAYDFGDAVRFAANTASEDEVDLDKVSLDLELYEAFASGFIGGSEGFFNNAEIESMALGAKIITMELAARFLEDYISGDKYFKTSRKNHNLDRARNQMKLVLDMENKFEDMCLIVHKHAAAFK